MTRLQTQRSKDILSILLLITLAFLFWGAALRPEEGQILYGFDLERLFHPFGDFMYQAFRDGDLPPGTRLFSRLSAIRRTAIIDLYPLTWPMQWLPLTVCCRCNTRCILHWLLLAATFSFANWAAKQAARY